MTSTAPLLPPPLIHSLRSRSFPRLFRMTGNVGNRGFGRYLRQRIANVVRREKTLVEKAITVAYMGSYLVDHIVNAEKLATQIIEGRSMTDAEEQRAWENTYGRVLHQLSGEHPEDAKILETVAQLSRYSEISPVVFGFRSRHWARIARLFDPSRGSIKQSSVYLLRRIQDVLHSRRSSAAKGRSVVLMASLLADMECWEHHQSWPEAYSHIATDIYPLLTPYPDVLGEMIGGSR